MIVGALFAIGLAFAAFSWERRLPWLLGATLAVPATSVLNAGGQSIGAFQLGSLLVCATGAMVWLRVDSDGPLAWPGALVLLTFVGWASLTTLTGPILFDGALVLTGDGGIDQQVAAPSMLTYTLSNVAQWGYLAMSAIVICYLATRLTLSPHIATPGLAGAMLLSNWRLAFDKLGVPYPVAQIDNNIAVRYINATADGGYRLRGVFPEPAGIALYGLAALAIGLAMIPRTRGLVRLFYVAMCASAMLNIAFAGSGTAFVAGSIMIAVIAGVSLWRAVVADVAVLPVLISLLLGLIVLVILSQQIIDYVSTEINDKVGSNSYAARTAADIFSLRLGLESYGLGVGLGSNRPSSLLPMLLSCTGLVGLALFLFLVARMLVGSARVERWRPAFWLLLTVVITKSIAGSNLSDPVLVLALGMAAHAGTLAYRSGPDADDADQPSDPIRDSTRARTSEVTAATSVFSSSERVRLQ